MIIGIDIGGTKCQVILAEENGAIRRTVRFATQDCAATLAQILDAVRELEPGDSPCFGIACGGPLDCARGMILSPPNLPGWDAVPIVEHLTSRFGGRGWLMNDANAGALAEWQFGAGRGTRNMVFLTHATGLGGGLILDGRLYEGTTGDAGEVGHVRLAPEGPVGYRKAGSFEGFCSGTGIALLARRLMPSASDSTTARDVAEAARGGDPAALKVFEESGRRLGEGLSLLIDILNPECIVLGSMYVRCADLLDAPMRAVLERETLETPLKACRIVPAQLGERLGEYQAIAVATYHLSNTGVY